VSAEAVASLPSSVSLDGGTAEPFAGRQAVDPLPAPLPNPAVPATSPPTPGLREAFDTAMAEYRDELLRYLYKRVG
jgi:hypothetical protein